jgi:hypothetical protein
VKNTLRPGLPVLPQRMQRLPMDERGYPVPFFVAWVDGKPDHRLADPRALRCCVEQDRCWICGEPLGRFKAFTIGPMCTITRVISEPPQHLECATFAAKACPFLSRPQAKRRDANLPEEIREPAGISIKRNPGAVCVWVTLDHHPFACGGGLLFELGEPTATHWFCEGRQATRAEVEESIDSGLPILEQQARADGNQALDELAVHIGIARALLNKHLPSEPYFSTEGSP